MYLVFFLITFFEINILIFEIYMFLLNFIYTFILYVKPWAVPLQVVVVLRRG